MNTEDSSQHEKYYTDNEIAGLLGISLGRLRNKLCAGSPLPSSNFDACVPGAREICFKIMV